MKSRYSFPLVGFLLVTGIPSALFMPSDMDNILGFASLLFGFTVTYLSMVAAALRHRAPILKGLRAEYRVQVEPRTTRAQDTRKTLVLVNPVNPHKTGLTINASSRFPPLGLGVIAALTPSDYRVILVDENIRPFEFVKGDLVGVTAFTSSANRAYEIADRYRAAGIPVVMGGIHASMASDEALHHASSIVIGEAEGVWNQVLSDFEAGALKPRYEGAATDLSEVPAPRRDLFSPEYLFATVQSSRGCPMDCYFCSVTPFNGKRYRQRPVEAVLDEIEALPQDYLFFVDDNILGYGQNAEGRAIRLFKGMVERKLEKSWFCQASINFADNPEVLRWAAKSGCKMVFIGLESADPEELEAMGKSLNLKREYERAFRAIHRHGIAVLGAFIFGSDAETEASMVRKTDYIQKAAIDVVQTTVLTPLPGTRLFAQYEREGRLTRTDFPVDWDRYDMGELTYTPARMEGEAFHRMLGRCWKRIYSPSSLVYKFLRTLFLTRSLTTAFWAYGSNVNYRNTGSRKA